MIPQVVSHYPASTWVRLVATGLRVSETCSLTVADVDIALRLATVRSGKGDKARVVRFDAATAAALDRYLRARGRHPRHAPAAYDAIRSRRDTARIAG